MARHKQTPPKMPSQRQLRAGELIRHALVDILQRGPLRDPALDGVIITVTEVRPSPDLKSAKVYVAPMGGEDREGQIRALNRGASFLRGRLGQAIDMKFTPELRFHADDRFDAASRIDAILARPEVARDLRHDDDDTDGED
ncbi:30S ribosome-binding factor RbfA [Hyphobacterium marinum]|uniref:Ribosome-binding factor A n=1 Tax=Hyphobacterium marinum TaxID=3116574 RepID=A0ABU7LV63_9PROT|nr:30S ribosome-binding factor RbfA [Hyphobacterium sp. Y6023]MEE2565454.1 30S ribosome-binding factor RbfA [Hyphobacterium sp. Y6023]